MSDTNWIPGLVVAATAVVVGSVLALRARGHASPSGSAERRVDLIARKSALYDAIRSAADVGQADERARLEIEAAQVLYDLDHIAPDAPPAYPTAAPVRHDGFSARHPQLIGALWGAGIVGFGGALYVLLQDYTKPRTEMGSLTGNAQSDGPVPAASEQASGRAASASQAAELATLQAAADAAPADIAAQNAYAHALIGVGRVMDAFHISEKIVALDPANAEARTHQAVVLLDIGDMNTAAKVLDRVLEKNPTFAEALGYRGALYYEASDTENAIATWERALVADPAYADEFTRLIAMAKRGPPTQGDAGDAGGVSPGTGTAPSASAASSSGPAETMAEFTGSVTVAAATNLPAGTTLFVYARAPGVDAGPPLRVVRVASPTFPHAFSISAANAPMGGNLTGPVVLTARLDGDGNPMTKDAADLVGKSQPIEAGASGVLIQLAPPP